MKKFGGSWTVKKLDAFINYVKAYTTILNSVKKQYNWKTIYFDGFAGYGERKIEIDTGYSTLDCFPDENDYNLYQGSVARILNLPNVFPSLQNHTTISLQKYTTFNARLILNFHY